MKKILTITLAIITLWLISIFFIGNQTEKHLQKYIESSNKLYSNSGVHLKLLDYNKSFLTSTAQIEVNFNNPEIVKIFKSNYKVNYSIEHGPLFFKNGFGFGLSKMEHKMNLSSLLQKGTKESFLSTISKDITLNSDVRISFTKEADYHIWSDEIKFNKDGKKFHMTAFQVFGTSNLETLKGSGEMKIEKITLSEEKNSNGIEIKNLLLNASVDELIDNSLVFGDFGFSIDNFIINDESNLKFKKIDFAFKGIMKNVRNDKITMDTFFEGDINLKNTLLPDEFKTLERLYLKMNVKNLGIQGMLDFQKSAQVMQEKQSKLLTQIGTKNPQEMEAILTKLSKLEEEMVQQIIYSLNNLLIKDKTEITYEVEAETKDKKRSHTLVKAGYTGDIKFTGNIEELNKKIQKEMFNLISLNLNLSLNKEHIKILPNNKMLQQQIQMGVLQGFVKENNNSYDLNGYYKNRELIINDKNLTSTLLPFLMMATQM
jgi:hypothetical protein